MKKKGSVCDYIAKRDAELFGIVRGLMIEADEICLGDLLSRAVLFPSSRFWVSEERATVILSRLFRGCRLSERMRPLKRMMFLEIYERAKRLREMFPDMSLPEVASRVVLSEAPQFYLDPNAVKVYLHKYRKQRRL